MKGKGKAVKWFCGFLVFMLVCGIVSRGIYANQMPKVTTAAAESGKLNHKVEGEGIVEAKEENPFLLPSGITVASICVRQGQKVQKGDVLLYLDMESLKTLYEVKQQELELAKTRLSDYRAEAAQSADNHATNVNRANEDYNNTKNSTDSNVSGAESAYNNAKKELENLPSLKQDIKENMEQDEKYRELYEATKTKDAAKEDKDAFKDYKAQLEEKLKQEYEGKKQSLKEEVSAKKAAVSGAKEEQSEKMKEASRVLEDANKPEVTEEATGLEYEQMIGQLEKQCNMYKEYIDNQGAVRADKEAYVSKILVDAGGITTETGAMALSTIGDTLFFTGTIAKDNKKYISIGDAIDISFGSRIFLTEIPIIAIGEEEETGYKFTAEIPSRGCCIGDSGTFHFVNETENYECLVPLEALHSENYEDFVYYIEKQETVLGTELVAKKRKVKVMDKDEEFAAIEGGSFTEEEQLILEADKKFQVGSRVRMDEF